ncbi:MAG TPA: hypothetical protein VKV26_17550 [Dehalococcoidia bacterium]|nr:hypothetical protein [Dehalococcoidia bacterium]
MSLAVPTVPGGSPAGLARRAGVLFAIVALLAFGGMRSSAARVHAQTGPTVTVDPASGNQNDVFTFTGAGFAPGAVLAELYQDPTGQQYTFYVAGTTTPTVIVADDGGNWSVTVTPATDFAGAYAGTWTVVFCDDSGNCFSGTIDISV